MMKKIIFLLLITTISFAQDESLQDKLDISTLGNKISVTIGGSFIVNGSFPASNFERVDQFVTRVFNLYKAQSAGSFSSLDDPDVIEKSVNKLDNFARRNIKLKRNGEELFLDLEKFRITGDFSYNPYLKNDDVLIFPALDLNRKFVSVDGAVNRPIKFQFVEGDRLSDALLFAQGISNAYENVENAEISRLSFDGMNEEIIKVKLTENFSLKPGDRIKVLANETNRKDYKALVLGEVNQPGYISITKGNTTVKQLIEKAGGFTEKADLNRTELVRGSYNYTSYQRELLTKGSEKLDNTGFEAKLYDQYNNSRLEELMMKRNYMAEDSISFNIDEMLRYMRRNSLVDFTNLEEESSKDANYIVRDGDIIYVPEKTNLVFVYGQVASTGYQNFVEGKDVGYYVNQAGGLSAVSKDIEDAVVIKAKSRSWVRAGDENVKIEAGDYIYLPKKIPKDFSYYMSKAQPVAAVIGTLATVVILIYQLTQPRN